ncbi:matrixin family metalloprotease [Methanocella conradii]|uniref:matrixin family metalloprotease n=1 Tax=Methanocella conradii TaxID=1175444 RepID=UPI00157CBA9B|nr:matrixin family metalloprotease [Methanocella conradii]
MVSIKSLWPMLAALLIATTAAFVGFPLYVHQEVVKATGAYAPLYLYEYSPYDEIVLEVHYQQDAAPSDVALEGLRQMLVNYTGKRVEVQKYGDLPASVVEGRVDDGNVSVIGAGIIERYGHCRMGELGGSIPIYIIYLNAQGPSSNESEKVVGMSYRADSFVILKNYMDSERLEEAVLIHEAGHLLGLEHCEDQKCVMASVHLEKRSWKLYGGGPPTKFCPMHQKELEDRRHDLFYNSGLIFQNTMSPLTKALVRASAGSSSIF